MAGVGTETTIVEVFKDRVSRYGDRVALRRRGPERWQDISWRQYGAAVDDAAWALLAQGVEPGDRVGILSANRPEWLYADLGILSIGAVSVPIYPTLIPSQTEHVVAHSEMVVLVVDSEAQRDKIRSIRSKCPSLRLVVVLDGGVGPGEMTWRDFLAHGEAMRQRDGAALERAQATISPDRLATLVYTSGTTGPPKGAMLSHANLLFEAAEVQHHVNIAPGEETLSFLPLSHVAERLQGELMAIYAVMVVNFARSIETVREDLPDVRPTVLLCVPRLWEKIHEGIMGLIGKAPPRRQAIFRWAIKVGTQRWRRQLQQQPVGGWLQAQAALADKLVASKVRQRLGLDRARFLISGAAPLAPSLQEFFAALGLPIMEAYGQTECTGVSHGTPGPNFIRPGRVGINLSGIQVRLASDGEILIRGNNVFMGYYKDLAATQAAMVDGWLHTGDIGEVDADGFLKITDRKKDIIVTAGGKNVAPQNIENRLKAFRGISQVVVLGDKRKFLIALVTLEHKALEQVLGQSIPDKASESEEVRRYVQQSLDAVNRELSSYETVKRFAILDTEFTVDSGELTPSLKVKRRVIDERYRHVIDGLYAAA